MHTTTRPAALQQPETSTANAAVASEDIKNWIVTYIANLLEISSDEIDTDVSFDAYGLDSSAAIGLTGDLEDWLGTEIEPTLLYDYPTVDALVDYLS